MRFWFQKPKPHEPAEGESARKRTEAQVGESDVRWPEVQRVANSMRELRRRNRFAEQIRNAMEGR